MTTNQITIQGNLGSDPEVKQVKDYQLCTFSVAHTPRNKKGTEWVDGETMWFRVVVWGEYGDLVATTYKKGDTVQVTGKFAVSKYTAKDGTEKSGNEIVATDVLSVPKASRRSVSSVEDIPGW
jgi:single-strand DNA-binding protein